MKRLLAALLVLTMLFTCMAIVPVYAEGYATATVRGGWLRLRAEASDKSETISAYFTGTEVTILGGSGSWYRVLTPDGKTGYMHSGYLTISGSITGGQLAENTTATVTSANGKPVRLRSGPGTAYSTLASYDVGTPLTIMTTGETWCKVRINGRTGYMMTEFIKADGKLPSNYTAYVVADNGKNCVVRSGPSKQDAVIASWEVGKRVTVREYGSTWSCISADGITGYMMSQYLSTTKPEGTTVVNYTAYVTSSNGLGVRMRMGAGTIYPTIATYSVGTQVTVLEKGAKWTKIRVGNQTGYMMTEFLTTQAPDLGITVKINATNAEVGDVLTAQVTPANANVSVAWVNDRGQTLSYGTTYTVRSDDAGRKIRASATGIGNTSGSDVSGWCTVAEELISRVYYLSGVTISDTTPTVGQTLSVTLAPAGATASIRWYRDNGTQVGTGSTYTVRSGDIGSRLYVIAMGSGNTSGEVTSSRTGFVTTGAVTTVALKSVSISDTTPTVGQTLTATVQPANATAAFTWRCSDGRILGYDSNYQVTEAENGKSIYVYANGTDGTSGSVVSGLTSPVTSGASADVRINGVTLNDLTPVVGQTLTATLDPANASATLMWLRDDDVILAYGRTYTVRQDDLGHTLYVWAEGTNGTFGSANSKITEPVTK